MMQTNRYIIRDPKRQEVTNAAQIKLSFALVPVMAHNLDNCTASTCSQHNLICITKAGQAQGRIMGLGSYQFVC
jgi:hypothetical protein